MKKTFAILLGLASAIAFSCPLSAAVPDTPGSKLITIQGGGGPGYGGLISGNIAMANLGAAHLYGGLQVGANFRHGAVGARKTELSLAPRLMLGWNLGKVVEFHVGAFAGIDAVRFDADKSQLAFCYSGFGGFRFNISNSFALVAEGYYAYPQKFQAVPYGSAGFAFRF